MKIFQPVIKWSGSKRSQAKNIVSYFPREINTYYEPFCGGCSVLRQLLESDINVKNYVCSDINESLIELWNVIKNDPFSLSQVYKELFEELNCDNDIKRQQIFYNKIRRRFNEERSPIDFMFLNRTCYNGLIRYNSKGEFNSPFHINRSGIKPNKLRDIIYDWSNIINEKNVKFKLQEYNLIKPNECDFIYLDPPYHNTNGMYYNYFDSNQFFKWLTDVNCKWVLSYNGKSGNEDKTFEVPKHLYDEHYYLSSGNSSFKRLKGIDKNAMVYESLYLKK